MATGENLQALRQILDLTRKLSILILLVHAYLELPQLFGSWGLVLPLSDNFLQDLAKLPFLGVGTYAKYLSLGLLLVSLLGAKGKKDVRISWIAASVTMMVGGLLFMASAHISLILERPLAAEYTYAVTMLVGYLLVLYGGGRLSRYLRDRGSSEVFNHENETFPQEERKLVNEYSINLPAQYQLKRKIKNSWINIINPFRALLVLGTPGSGKSYFVIRHVITQHIAKGFSMFVYDFKYDDLSRIAYNALLRNKSAYAVSPKFYTINFDDLSRSHRCNPLEPSTMLDITDASESSRTIMMGLNREWIKKQGDFFVESPINFLTAVIWFLKRYKQGKYCTLPHVIEMMQTDYDKLFSVLRCEPEIEVLINPFVSAFMQGATDQLEGQIASAKITMARLSSPQLYYVLSESEFTLDVNNPQKPKIICMGNNPQKQQVYGAVLSLYISRITKLVNQKGKLKSSLIFDEFPTIYFNGIDNLIATARSNKVATCLGVQDYSQLKKDYGREQAEVVMNTVGNILSGQVLGDTAKQLSDRFGKIRQPRQSRSVNSNDTSISHSVQLDLAVPQSTIASLSSGEFVGLVADTPDQPMKLKGFHARIINDHEGLKREEEGYLEIPACRKLDDGEVLDNYKRIKAEVNELVESELERMMDSPGLARYIIQKR
ncbi:conjugal transfer protein TraG [Echinicola strongylocentroti]|uniref:Conjugal transfer protein TraG n=2 Tax=Echinicola strongylocentroti TaxID=1795355 RepID=A0A2Z4IEV2_9BACT|nr:conjugal transfer protein MobC [Echinicola strongylocentroti]AWW29454.1 conjugal transfer protein TraG [Echinicola strongylocentroti]